MHLLKRPCDLIRLLAAASVVVGLFVTASVSALGVVKSPNDTRSYDYFVLPNQLSVLLISDPTSDKAAASLDVNVGSADDPGERAGLAHFLEHMLFLGTEAYPDAGSYQTFISANGGSHNAYTSPEHTNYFFDIDHSKLSSALDRFSQFFVAPLFTAEYVDRERNAVHSEYKAKIKNPYRRELDVYRHLVSPLHPMSKFSVGSLETLADLDGDEVRDALLKFYENYYSANNMKLVVLGRESLPELRAMVESHFNAIALRGSRNLISGVDLFRKNFLPARVQIKSEQDVRRLSMVFPIPSAQKYYREKPLQYIGNLLGHEGKGSLFSLLKELGWAEGLSAGAGSSGGRNQGTFNIAIKLTPEGYANQAKVVATTFKMIQRIRDDGVEKWRFDEQRRLSAMAFRFAEKGDPIHEVSRLSGQMHRYIPEDVIRGSYAFDRFNDRLIRRYLKLLVPSNFLWVTTAREVEADEMSSLYQTPYALEHMRYKVAKMPKMQLDRLALPTPNKFIPKRLDVKSIPSMGEVAAPLSNSAEKNTPENSRTQKNIPENIKSSDSISVWFKQDDIFRVPRANIRIRALSPLVGQSVKEAALSHLYAALVSDALNEFAYPAALAGLHFDVSANSRGFDFQVSGYNDRQGLLLSRILDVLDRGRFSEERFISLQQEMVRTWRNQQQLSPYEQLSRKMPAILYSPFWDEQSMADALVSVTRVDLRRFAEQVWQGAKVQVLIHGNFYRQEALKLATIIEHKLYGKSDEALVMPKAQVVNLSSAPHHYHLSVDHKDVAAAYYQQARGTSVEDRAAMMMIRQMLRSSFFHQLRTEKQLGYIVFMSGISLKDVEGNIFLVQSPSTPLVEVMAAIQAFVTEQAGSLKSFEQHRSALLSNLEEAPKNLQEQSSRFWSEIVTHTTDFDRRQRLIEAIKALKPNVVADYSRAVMGEPQAIWFTAGAEPPAVGISTVITDIQAFKADQPAFIFP